MGTRSSIWKAHPILTIYMNKIIIIILIMAIACSVFANDTQHRLNADSKAVSNALLATAAGSIVLVLFPGWMLGDELSDRYGYQDYPFAKDDGFKIPQGQSWDFYLSANDRLGDEAGENFRFKFESSWKRVVLETEYQQFTFVDVEAIGSELQIMPSFIFAHNEYVDFRLCAGYSLYGMDTEGSSLDVAYKIRAYRKPMFYKLSAENCFYFDEEDNDNNDQFQRVQVAAGYIYNRFEINLEYEYRFMFEEVSHTARLGFGVWL